MKMIMFKCHLHAIVCGMAAFSPIATEAPAQDGSGSGTEIEVVATVAGFEHIASLPSGESVPLFSAERYPEKPISGFLLWILQPTNLADRCVRMHYDPELGDVFRNFTPSIGERYRLRIPESRLAKLPSLAGNSPVDIDGIQLLPPTRDELVHRVSQCKVDLDIAQRRSAASIGESASSILGTNWLKSEYYIGLALSKLKQREIELKEAEERLQRHDEQRKRSNQRLHGTSP